MEDIVALKLKVHRQYLDPLWRTALRRPCYKDARRYPEVRVKIIQRARERVYEWIAFKTGRQLDDVHVRQLDEAGCLEVIELLRDVEYETIRDWAVRRDKRRKRMQKMEMEDRAQA